MPRKEALIVVDMLNDFLREDGALYCGPAARKIIPEVKRLVDRAHREGHVVVFLADSHDPDDAEFDMFPVHCVEGQWGAELIEELERKPDDYWVKKKRYSGFYNTDLDAIINREGIEKVTVVGVCTSICVMDTVGGFRNRDIETVVPANAVADFDPEAHSFALKRMEKIYGAKVVPKV